MTNKILVIDDDSDVPELISIILKPNGYIIYHASDGPNGIKKAYEIHPDLIILDVMMPGLDGYEVCSRLREMTNVPVLMLTACTTESDVLRGFFSGVDDYLKKPFNQLELEARVRALLRRIDFQNQTDNSLVTKYVDTCLEFNIDERSATLHGEPLNLSPTEFSLLAYLIKNQGKVVSQREILREVWGQTYANCSSTISLYIYYLRKKLKDGQNGHQYIHTQWGRGYWFAPKSKG